MNRILIALSVVVLLASASWFIMEFSWNSEKNEELNKYLVSLYDELTIGEEWAESYSLIVNKIQGKSLTTTCTMSTDEACGVVQEKQNIVSSNYFLSIETEGKKVSFLRVANPEGQIIKEKGRSRD